LKTSSALAADYGRMTACSEKGDVAPDNVPAQPADATPSVINLFSERWCSWRNGYG
jgi:hypothetical protein